MDFKRAINSAERHQGLQGSLSSQPQNSAIILWVIRVLVISSDRLKRFQKGETHRQIDGDRKKRAMNLQIIAATTVYKTSEWHRHFGCNLILFQLAPIPLSITGIIYSASQVKCKCSECQTVATWLVPLTEQVNFVNIAVLLLILCGIHCLSVCMGQIKHTGLDLLLRNKKMFSLTVSQHCY